MNEKQKDYLWATVYCTFGSMAIYYFVILLRFIVHTISFLITSDYIDTYTEYSPARLVFILIVGLSIMMLLTYWCWKIGYLYIGYGIETFKKIFGKR